MNLTNPLNSEDFVMLETGDVVEKDIFVAVVKKVFYAKVCKRI